MLRPPLAWRISSLTILLSCYSVCLFAQSALTQTPNSQTADEKTSPTLDVVSAEYVPKANSTGIDMIRYTLRNNGQKIVTAYRVETPPSGYGEDFINLAVNAQCRSSRANSQASSHPDSQASAEATAESMWEGSIKPGETHTNSIPANIDKEKVNGETPSFHIFVSGVLWSDGTMEAEGFNRKLMEQTITMRRLQAEDGARVIAILEAHRDDPDIQHRLAEISEAIDAIAEKEINAPKPPRQTSTQKEPLAVVMRPSAAVQELQVNLKMFRSLPDPQESFEAYSASFECRYKTMASLIAPAPAAAEPPGN